MTVVWYLFPSLKISYPIHTPTYPSTHKHTCFGQTSFKTTIQWDPIRSGEAKRDYFKKHTHTLLWLCRISKSIFVSWKQACMKFFNINLINIKCIHQNENEKEKYYRQSDIYFNQTLGCQFKYAPCRNFIFFFFFSPPVYLVL